MLFAKHVRWRLGVGLESTYSCLLEESLAGSFAGAVSSLAKMLRVDKGNTREHDCMIQQQAGLTVEAIAIVHNGQEWVNVQQWHVGVNVFDKRLQQSIL